MDASSQQQWTDRLAEHVGHIEAADPGHDFNHIKRVVKSALQFAQAEGANLWVVLPAAWLHDCVPVAKNSPLRSQASQLAADAAVDLLQQWHYPKEHLAAIHHAICAHSYSANIPCQSLEAQVVQDADRMDALGAIGIARTLMVGTGFGHPLTFHEDPFCYHREANDQAAIIDHFYTKLLKLKDSFNTAAARSEATERHQFMQQFLQQLEGEMT
ncbi:HD domain-containing protein [Marinicella meishanensis]|uniref:HD domain-containing protein n=1 Tax=Marinicella meishanensis TaxID=2873263 RepID=UPI001CC18963|nr:HD domain-containing protein [Marinicella sp. NBU2979]